MTSADRAQVVLRLDNITKRFGTLTANDAVSFILRAGEVIALLGENGAGKTTLMNILFGHYTADEGQVSVRGRRLPPGQPRAALDAGVGMVHQHFALAGNLTVQENIALGTESLWRFSSERRKARARILELSERFGLAVAPDAKIADLTVGERQRVEILKALYRDARILILDEPTAVLTPGEAEDLFATLRKAVAEGLSVIFISHKMHEVLAVSSRIIVLRHGRIVGDVRTAETDRHSLAEMMVGGTVAEPELREGRPGAPLMRLTEVSTAARPHAMPLDRVTLDLRAGQITGLAGVSGNGQAALAAVVGGFGPQTGGTIEICGQPVASWSPRKALSAGVARIPEDRHATGTIADLTLTENAMLEGYANAPFSRGGWIDWRAARSHAEQIIKRFDVRCPSPETPVRHLSGGNMQKLILGRALAPSPRIILADQPVRGLDVGAAAYLQSQLIAARNRGAAVLLISEDLDKILELADIIHVIFQGRLSPPFPRGTMNPAELGVWMSGHGFELPDAA